MTTNWTEELICEAIDAMGDRCSECGETAAGDKLLIYTTVRGNNIRTHNGAFCSKFCHDYFHRLHG
jgi:hypothetical protein